jgi:hypothetical protein
MEDAQRCEPASLSRTDTQVQAAVRYRFRIEDGAFDSVSY